MATLLLRLAAPLQAWGVDSKFEIRKTNREPTKSGVLGLLAAALGLRRDDEEGMRELGVLRFAVRVDQEGGLLVDFHTANNPTPQQAAKARAAGKAPSAPYVTRRHYLTDAVFLVGLESGDERLLQRLESALRSPAFPLFLGRRSCPPTQPLCLGIRQTELVRLLQLGGVEMTRETLVKIERGTQHIRASQLRGIRDALHTTYDALLAEAEK